MPRAARLNRTVLEAALIGLELKLQRLDSQITQLRGMLGGRGRAVGARRGRMSEAARKRIADAQRKRWSEWRKAKGKGG